MPRPRGRPRKVDSTVAVLENPVVETKPLAAPVASPAVPTTINVIQKPAEKPKHKPSPEELGTLNDPKSWVVFYNMQTPDEELQFSYGYNYYHLKPGRKYLLAKCVIDRINSRKFPLYQEADDENGQRRPPIRVGEQPRCMCTPCDPPENVDNLSDLDKFGISHSRAPSSGIRPEPVSAK